jgi:hypothetical protein
MDFEELKAKLSPKYLKNMPVHDAWGTPYKLFNGSVASGGSDRRFDQKTLKGDISIDRGTEDDHGGDLIEYYVYPKLGSVPTNASKPALLVRETVAVLDGGKFWVVQGLVANSSTNAHLFGTHDSATATWSCRETGQPAEVDVPKNIDAPQGDIDPLTPGNIGYFQILVKPRFGGTCTPVPTLAFHSGGQELPYAIDPDAQPKYRN